MEVQGDILNEDLGRLAAKGKLRPIVADDNGWEEQSLETGHIPVADRGRASAVEQRQPAVAEYDAGRRHTQRLRVQLTSRVARTLIRARLVFSSGGPLGR